MRDKKFGRELYWALRAELIARFGEDVGAWLAPRVAKMYSRTRGVEQGQTSHFRACDLADHEQVAEYERVRDKGCCSFIDREFHHFKSGRRFRVGFNYGH